MAVQKWPTVEDVLPKNWGICLLGQVYCPKCYAMINGRPNDWISVNDSLPDTLNPLGYSKRVLVVRTHEHEHGEPHVEIGYLDRGVWRNNDGRFYEHEGFVITHWTHLPEAP